jgi:MoaA/NifB/PqqE/SkfB family radical SAM enzyme
MCFQDRQALANRGEMTAEQITRFFDANPCLRKITFIGGEIFMRPDMMDIIRHLDQTRAMVLCTNATLLGESEIDALTRCRRIYTFCISLEGPEAVHESVRRIKGSYSKTVRAIRALTRYFPITVNAVIQNENLNVLPALIDICAELKVKKVKLELERLFHKEGICQAVEETLLDYGDLPLSSAGRGRQYSLEDLKRVLSESQVRGRKAGIYVTVDPPFLMDNLEPCYYGRTREKIRFISQSFRTATIAPNGDLINCITIRKPFGNILKAPFDQVWNSKSANAFRRNLLENNLTPMCENCPFMNPV